MIKAKASAMKKLLVPTDFSACATYATEVAIALAEFYSAKLILYHQLELPASWDTFSEDEKLRHPEVIQQIQEAVEKMETWKACAAELGVALTFHYSSGNLVDEIRTKVQNEQIDFVVMGSHGASGFNEYIMGSNTQKVVRSLHCPVFIVKNQLKEYAINKVIFASNFVPEEKKAFEYLLKFAVPFEAEIHLVEINTSSWFGQPYQLVHESMKDFKAMCTALPCYLHFHRNTSVEKGIQEVADRIDADLIAISNHHRHPVKRVFAGSNVEALVNHSPLPVLSIDWKE